MLACALCYAVALLCATADLMHTTLVQIRIGLIPKRFFLLPPMLSQSPTSIADRAAMASSTAALPVAARGKWSLAGSASKTKRRASTAKWTAEEDAQLCSIVEAHSAKDWRAIASNLPGRTDVQCLHRWKKVLRPGLKKGKLGCVTCANT